MLSRSQKLFLWSSGTILALSVIWLFVDPSRLAFLFSVAMLFSFTGDLLMKRVIKLTERKLVDGVVGFGFAHTLYLVGLFSLLDGTNIYLLLLIDVVLALALLRIVAYRPDRPLQSAAIFIYIVLLLTLLSLSGILALQQGHSYVILAIGFAMFVASDTLIGVREFHGRFRHDNLLVSITYLLAQALIQIFPHI